MGSTSSRPRLRKVGPCNSPQVDGEQLKSQWTLPGLPVTQEQPLGFLGRQKTILPPLKQEITLSSLSGNLPQKHSKNSSIIHSHPPRRPQLLQPLALQIGHASTDNQIAMGRDCRDGGVHQCSTTGQTGQSGTSRMIQGRFLEAQAALLQQDYRHRKTHLRQAREQRRHKVVYTVNDPNTGGIQRVSLVRRPTERDIFWDESTGEHLDPAGLLQPKSLSLLHQPNKLLLCKGSRSNPEGSSSRSQKET